MYRTLQVGMFLVVTASAAMSLDAQSARELEAELRAAQYRERIQGDVAGALATYRRLITSSDRGVAANALLALAEAYERTGHADARPTFERVSREFADLPAAVIARRRLEVQRTAGATQRLLIKGPEANEVWSTICGDGRYLPFSHPETGNVAIRHLSNGRTTLVTKTKGYEEGFTEAIACSPDASQLAYSLVAQRTRQTESDAAASRGSHRRHATNSVSPRSAPLDAAVRVFIRRPPCSLRDRSIRQHAAWPDRGRGRLLQAAGVWQESWPRGVLARRTPRDLRPPSGKRRTDARDQHRQRRRHQRTAVYLQPRR